jgi:ATP phosphoribosyltransferase
MINMNDCLKIAIQKSGRLHETSMELLKDCGIHVANGGKQLRVISNNFPLELFFLRDDDIPEYVQDGVADCGIVGDNVVQEKNKKIETVQKLGFGKCRLSLAVPKQSSIDSITDLNGLRIATSYPLVLAKYLSDNNLKASIHEISGSVEIAPKIGLADAICDLVSSGSTLFTNELKEIATILFSEAVLISNPQLEKTQQLILEKLLFRIRSVQQAKNNKYVLLNAPNDKIESISRLLPGIKSPTILPLAKKGWSSLHSVIAETDFWNVIEQLKENGAEGILIIPIEKMVV